MIFRFSSGDMLALVSTCCLDRFRYMNHPARTITATMIPMPSAGLICVFIETSPSLRHGVGNLGLELPSPRMRTHGAVRKPGRSLERGAALSTEGAASSAPTGSLRRQTWQLQTG